MGWIARGVVLAAAVVFGTGAGLAETIRVGVLAPFSGPFAIYGKQFQEGIETYVAEHGTQAGPHTIEFVFRDTGGPNPDAAKALAQELLIRDEVDYLAGFVFTPNALAVAPLIERSETPTVIFNAATSAINARSEFFVRTSFTLWQISVPMAEWARAEGIGRVATAVTDYGPGLDAERAFASGFEAAGGEVVDAIRMPIQTTDFAPFMQRLKASGAEAVFAFLPVGPPVFGFMKAYAENGLAAAGIRFLGTGETDEATLQQLGDGALGAHTAYHYSNVHESAANAAFKGKLAELYPDAIAQFATVGAYDGTHLIYAMVEAAGADGKAAIEAAKGLAWESPRGPVEIDPETRHVTQNVYIRVVEKEADGLLVNREIETYPAQPDLGWGVE